MTDIDFGIHYSPNGSGPEHTISVVPLDTFIDTHEEFADPLIGHPDDTLLPADGTLLMYGDGGAGKTTLTIDALAHLASGTDWLGLTVPEPLRILIIENEGPRGPFRTRLGAKRTNWEGTPFTGNVTVLEDPWTRFTLTNDGYRYALAAELDRTETDLLMVGPLASLGARGTGTPDDINLFDELVRDLRQRTQRRFALWIVHHENKAGDVSGAWERYPDSLVHIQNRGNGRTHIQWRKVRWSSTLHGTGMDLTWGAGHGFELETKPERDRRAELLDKLTHEWKGISTLSQGSRRNVVEELLAEMRADGLVETITPIPGRQFNSVGWRLVPLVPEARTSGDLARPKSRDEPGRAGRATLLDPVHTPLVPPVPPYKGRGGDEQADEQGHGRPHTRDERTSNEPDEQDQAIIDAIEIERLEALARTYLAEEHQ